jgi:hypothetical protein
VYCWLFPAATVVVPVGVIAIDTRAAAVTVAVVAAVIPFSVAVMVGVPVETAVINPAVTTALALLEDHAAWVVMS